MALDWPDQQRLRAHQEWLGFLQPVGLVVSPHALMRAQADVDANVLREQERLRSLLDTRLDRSCEEERPVLRDLPKICIELLGWQATDLAGAPGGPALPDELTVSLPEYADHLAPSLAVPAPGAAPGDSAHWLLLIRCEPESIDLDTAADPTANATAAAHTATAKPARAVPGVAQTTGWLAAPQIRFERLLRDTGVPIGLLTNGDEIRLVYAPRGESSGHLSFPFAAMCAPAGRPILSAFLMLLGSERLFTLPDDRRLPHLLRTSRQYQNEVSTALAQQVQGALWDLLRGFEAAANDPHATPLRAALDADPQAVYGGLLTTLLRLVFLLYAEDRGLLTSDPRYVAHYSVTGLFARLRDDAGRFPDTMDQRYGAFAQLLALFRLIHDGGVHGALRLPARHGRLFDPNAHAFLEGRAPGSPRVRGERVTLPLVPDGTVLDVLSKLLLLDGERLSYRALDVEQIGSVYESMMGFTLERAQGHAAALTPGHVVVDMDALLETKPAERVKRLTDEAGTKLDGKPASALREATTREDLLAALARRRSNRTPDVVAPGRLYLQPTEERRRSGSHYTPRSLTEPIVRATLAPILEGLGPSPHADDVLGLRVCDPAMGSGAFLVEACRFLGDAVVAAWQRHGEMPAIPQHEDPLLFARRLVAQQCLYGVDRNPFAVDLAKLSLWLATLAKEHPFTFLDHALRCGDSLVGLSREGIAALHWNPAGEKQRASVRTLLEQRLAAAESLRTGIQRLAASDDVAEKERLLAESDAALADLRLAADAVVSAFFSEEKDRARETARVRNADRVELALFGVARTGRPDQPAHDALEDDVHGLRAGERGLAPFHWEIEFPEVFARENGGFDAFVGNPPFAGKNTIIDGNRAGYLPWLQALHEAAHGNADLVAHFFRRAFSLLRRGGGFGLIATNTIAQGDTRGTGLRWIAQHGGTICAARRRYRWPGEAAVVVSVVHVAKEREGGVCTLDGRPVEKITAFLFHDGGHDDPKPLAANAGKSFQGSIVLGMGFTFDDTSDEATPIAEMQRLVAKDPRNAERIFPYLGGEEVNDSPVHAHRRWVIDFGERSEDEARAGWPDLMRIVEEKVKPERMKLGDNSDARRRKQFWWQFGRRTPALEAAIRGLPRVMVIARVSNAFAFTFLPNGMVYNEKIVVFPIDSFATFSTLQSRVHETWARFFNSTLKDDMQYTPSDCFETFPFPQGFDANAALEAAGRTYYEHRAQLMVANNEGLTKTYNRFHDPDEAQPGIVTLRALHAAMDRAVLDACGWPDLHPEPAFFPEHDDSGDTDHGSTEAAAVDASLAFIRRPTRRRFRLRWPDVARDEVLARLLALNTERATGEQSTGATAKAKKTPAKKPRGRATDHSTRNLFDD